MLFNSQVDAAVFEVRLVAVSCVKVSVLTLCDVAVVTNIASGDHLGVGGVDTLEQLVRVKRCIVEVVKLERMYGAQGRRPARNAARPKSALAK